MSDEQMIIAKIQVSGSNASLVSSESIPAGIVGAQIQINYAADIWQRLQKTVIFQGAVTKDVLTNSSIVTVPPEVVAKANVNLSVGVYGTDANGSIAVPTIWARLGTVRRAASPSGDTTTAPTLPVWAQIQTDIGNLGDLDTTDKSSLVAAINEAMTKGGGEVDPAAVQKIVEDYLKANPPQAGADGKDGITPTIGENGNWYLGDNDTGKPSRGATGVPGKDGSDAAVTAANIAGALGYTPAAPGDIPVVPAAEISANSAARHTHENKGVLDGITGQVTEANIHEPGHTTDLVQFGAFQIAARQLAQQIILQFPAVLPNPEALTIKIGSTTVTYDGSEAKTVEIADGSEVSY